jgi:WD40 repeat protein
MQELKTDSTLNERFKTLGMIGRALDQSAFALRDRPAECFPQLYGRLRGEGQANRQLSALLDARRRSYPRPWLRVLNWRPRPLIRTFAGHTSSIGSCQFCSGSERIVSSSMDGTVRIWETATGREIAVIGGFPWSRAVSFSPDDDMVAFPNDARGVVLASARDGQQLATLRFHDLNVSGCRFSPDGRWLASCGWDYQVAIWEVATATLHRTTRVNSEHSQAIFMPTGCSVVIQTPESLEIWDAETNRQRRFFRGTERVCGAELSPDGALIASSLDKRAIVVWDAASGEVVARQDNHPGEILSFKFLSDSRRMVSAGAEGPVLVWDARTGEELGRIDAGGADQVVIDPRERLLLIVRNRSRSLWDLETHSKRADLAGDGEIARDLPGCFSPDGRYLFANVGGFTNVGGLTVRVWDTETAAVLDTFGGHTGSVSRFAIDPAGRFFVAAGAGNNLTLWHIIEGGGWQPPAHTTKVSCCAAGPGNHAVASSLDGTVSLWDLASGEMKRRDGEENGTPVDACALSSDGELVADAGPGGLRISNMRAGEAVRCFRESLFASRIRACSFSPDGTRVAWLASGHGKFIAGTEGEAFPVVIPGRAFEAMRFLPPGDRLVAITNQFSEHVPLAGPPLLLGALNEGAAVLLLDALTGERLAAWKVPGDKLFDVACSPDGRLIATAAQKTVRVWSVEDGAIVAELAYPEGEARDCAFSPDGRWLMASGSGALRLWGTKTWREKGALKIKVACAPLFLPDGHHLLTAESASLVLWDVKTLNPVTTLTGLSGEISAAAVAPDGRSLIAGTPQGEVLVASLDGLKSVPVVTATADSVSLQVRCPSCGRLSEVSGDVPGHAFRCQSCAARVRVSALTARPAACDASASTESAPPPRKTSRPRASSKRSAEKSPDAPIKQKTVSLSEARPLQSVSYLPTPHPAADADRAAQLNIRYQKELAAWKALPFWKRLRTKKPEHPGGI